MMNVEKIPRSFGTHDGTFHADEVTACALLLLFNLIDEDKIIRTRNKELLNRCEFVCDVGGVYDTENKLFDHHQVEYQGPLSSAGMVLKYLAGKKIIQEKEYQFFNDSIMLGIDAHDNGRDPLLKGHCSFSHVISNFTPINYDYEPEEVNAAFKEALQFTLGHLDRLWRRFKYGQSCRAIVEESMNHSKEYLMFDRPLPWLESFFELNGLHHSARFVIMPSGKHWKLRGIPPSYEERMKVRLPLPQEWAGLQDSELRKVTGISGAIFCHKGRFISVWETKEDALKALDYILKQG